MTDILQRLREARNDTKRDMKRTDLRTKDVLLLSDLADLFDVCAHEIEILRKFHHDQQELHEMNESVRQTNNILREQLAAVTAERDELVAVLNEVNNWLVCACIATPEDMAQSFQYMQELCEAALAKLGADKMGEQHE